MSIIEFVEKVYGVKLLPYQKIFLTKYYEAIKTDKEIPLSFPRGYASVNIIKRELLTNIVTNQEAGNV